MDPWAAGLADGVCGGVWVLFGGVCELGDAVCGADQLGEWEDWDEDWDVVYDYLCTVSVCFLSFLCPSFPIVVPECGDNDFRFHFVFFIFPFSH